MDENSLTLLFFSILVSLVAVVLKLGGVITLAWIWVLLPVWLLAVGFAAFAITVIIGLLINLMCN